MSDSTQEEAHTGPIKTPKQLLWAAFFSFVVPVFIIFGLVAYVASENKPAGSNDAERYTLGGVTTQDIERSVAERLRKVGTVEIRDANRPLQTGQAVYKAQCAACHDTGAAGAPKFGDAAAWAARIGTGLEALVNSALKGKNAMPAQAGGDFEDLEIARGVAYMANAAGGKFKEPDRPAGAAPAAAPATPVAAVAAPAATAAPAPAAAAAPQVAVAAGKGGEALYKQSCAVCHAAGIAGAPKSGDKAAWAPRVAQGVPVLVASAIKGKNAMPPRGGAANASDADIRAAVEYMVSQSK
ncbi:MAG: c-type cytochrome [Pseudomonadota bacterium]